MKRCPECRRDYTDETLNFCLDDGAALLEGPASEIHVSEPVTAVLPTVAIPSERPTLRNVEYSRAPWLKRIAGLALVLAIPGGVAYWFFGGRPSVQSPPPQPKLTQITFADGVEEYPTWSSDGARVAYSGEVSGVRKIFIKQLENGEEKQLTQGAADDIQATWSPDGRTILFVRGQKPSEKLQPTDVFGNFEGGDIWSVDVQSGVENKIIDNAFNPAYSPDGKAIAYDASRSGPRRIWSSNSSGYNPQQISTDVSEEASHVRPRWSADGKRIVFQNIERTKFNIRTVEIDGRNMTWITNDLYNNLNPVWSRRNDFIYFSSDRGGGYNIWRIAVAAASETAAQPQQITTGAGQDVELEISPDGSHLAFSVLKQNADLWRLPVSPVNGKPTGSPEQVISTTREDSRGSLSPDGSRIAFNSDRAGEMNIWLFNLADRSTRQLTRGPGGDFQPTWSPDGRQIVFFSSRAGNNDIWTLDLDSGSLTQLTRDAATDINPFYSPDGRLIAYQSDRTGRTEIWLMNADGSADRQLTRVGVRGHFIRWNKTSDALIFRAVNASGWYVASAAIDGTAVVGLPNVKGGGHLSVNPSYSYVMDVTSHKTLWASPIGDGVAESVFEFPDPDARIDYPVWSPDGKWILFDRFRPEGGDIWMIENFE
jgi:Tol biopolymer transport system component